MPEDGTVILFCNRITDIHSSNDRIQPRKQAAIDEPVTTPSAVRCQVLPASSVPPRHLGTLLPSSIHRRKPARPWPKYRPDSS